MIINSLNEQRKELAVIILEWRNSKATAEDVVTAIELLVECIVYEAIHPDD